MLRSLLPLGLVLFLASCSNRPLTEEVSYRYRACVKDEYNRLDTGTVIGHRMTLSGEVVYLFQSDNWPADGKHIMVVRSVQRNCAAAQGRAMPGADQGYDKFSPPPPDRP